MPHTLSDVIRPRPCPGFRSAFTSESNPSILLEIPHTLGKQARGDEVQETCRHDEEDLQGGLIAAFVNEVAHKSAGTEAANNSQGEGCSGQTETDACDEPVELLEQQVSEGEGSLQHSLDTFSQHRDKR
jgi:hypothetical protein